MKKILTILASTFLLGSCAHHHKDVEHHHHKSCDVNCKVFHAKGEMFEKHCAQSISEGDLHVKGTEDFKLNHSGQVYYFSSEQKLDKFKKHLELNAVNAQKNWDASSLRR
jgi:YHS domain-containing protein